MTRCTLNLATHDDVDPLPVEFRREVPLSRGGGQSVNVLIACAGCRSASAYLSAHVIERRQEPRNVERRAWQRLVAVIERRAAVRPERAERAA